MARFNVAPDDSMLAKDFLYFYSSLRRDEKEAEAERRRQNDKAKSAHAKMRRARAR